MGVQRGYGIGLALFLVWGAAPVWAQSEDTLKLKIESALRHDSNLFRLPAATNTELLLGKPSAAERIDINSLSLSLSTHLSLQKVELSAKLTNYRYQNFSYLNFVARNYSVAWRWALTPNFHGNLQRQRQETINNFADYQGFNAQNLRSNSNNRLDAAYDIDGSWGLTAGVLQSTQTNQQPLSAEGDYSAKSADLGLRYASGSGSSLSYTLRNSDGTYLNRLVSPNDLYDDGFTQIDSELRLHWAFSGKSAVDIYTNQISRTHPHYAQRDYSGRNVGINLNWNFSGKLALTASWARELSSYQTSTSNYSQTDRIALGQVWQLSPKAVARARYEVTQSDYLGSPFGAVMTPRSDSTSGASLSFDWQPFQYLTISTSLENATRRSNLAGLDYESKMATVSAQFSY
jgi:exopolysaccharide biosynthesis operon protein EpsL